MLRFKDPAQAEALLGQPIIRSGISGSTQLQDPSTSSNAMSVDDVSPSYHMSSTPTVGTPIKLAPSTSVFKRAGAVEKPSTPLQQPGWGGNGGVGAGVAPEFASAVPAGQSPSKGVLGQVSDLIFGW